jgi:hypothetical protein
MENTFAEMAMAKMKQERAQLEADRATAQELFPETVFPKVSRRPLYFGSRSEKVLVPGRRALVDIATDIVFGIASDEYKLVHHESVIAKVAEAVGNLPEFGTPCWNLRLPAAGAKMVLEVKFPEVKYEVRVGDIINPKISVRQSYDLQWKMRSDFGAYRVVCSNGLTIGEKVFTYVNRHISTLDVGLMVEGIQTGMERFSENIGLWKKWADKKVLPSAYDTIWEELPFSPTEREKMEALPEADTKLLLPDALHKEVLTVWDFHNVVTQFVSHNLESEVRLAEIGPTIARVFLKHGNN